MRFAVVIVGLCAAVALAQDGLTNTDAIGLAVGQEMQMAGTYLDIILKFKHAQSASNAANFFLQEAQIRAREKGENFMGQPLPPLPQAPPSTELALTADKARLVGAFNLMSAVNVKLYQILSHIPEIQGQFYSDRVIQLYVSQLGAAANPTLLQALYLEAYNTQLKTLKLSYAMQTISHFRMWLEDEIDVGSSLASGSADAHRVFEQQLSDLITDRKFAFTALQTFTMLDLQSFTIETYLQNFGQTLASQLNATNTNTAFLEENATFVEGQQYEQYYSAVFFYFKMYYLYLQYNAAQAGAMSSALETQALVVLTDKDASNDQDGVQLLKKASELFTQYAANLQQASQIEYMMAIFSMYALYAPYFTQTQQAAATSNTQ